MMKQWVKISFKIYPWVWSISTPSASFSGVKSPLCRMYGKRNPCNYAARAGPSLKTILLSSPKLLTGNSGERQLTKIIWAFWTLKHHYSNKRNFCSPNTSYKMKWKGFNSLKIHLSSICWYLYFNTIWSTFVLFWFVFTHYFYTRKHFNKTLEWWVAHNLQ